MVQPLSIDSVFFVNLVSLYKKNFSEHRFGKSYEIYKWEAVKCFQDNWDIEAPDFAQMLKASLAKTANLLSSARFFPKKMIELFSEDVPEKVRLMFRNLFDEQKPLLERVEAFELTAEEMLQAYPDYGASYQTPNAISTYLWLRYPEKYYIYKYSIIKEVAKNLFHLEMPTDKLDRMLFGLHLCDTLREKLSQDKALVELSKSALSDKCDPDNAFNTLTIDIQYFMSQNNFMADTMMTNHYSAKTAEEKNIILYGPPGTGKTYHTTELAVKIADTQYYQELKENFADFTEDEFRDALKKRYDELVGIGRIVFTTFHQSYSYEDFIEGIRAVTNEDTNALEYKVEDGIFKRLCNKASGSDVKKQDTALAQDGQIDFTKRRIWKMSLGDTSKPSEVQFVRDDCFNNNRVLLGWGSVIDFDGCNSFEAVKQRYNKLQPEETRQYAYNVVHRFKNEMKKGDLIVISSGNKAFNAICEVTGDYYFTSDEARTDYLQARDVRWIKIYDTPRAVDEILEKIFSQQTFYSLNANDIKSDNLNALLQVDEKENIPNHVMIIDEINRGNISNIFGELITLLEEDKRAGAPDARSAILPYSKLNDGKPFSVPKNLYVIGTMNTADKSLTQLDLALRRRFSFKEMLPRPDLLEGITVYDINIAELLATLNARIEVLLGTEHQIGHSYFMPLNCCANEAEKENKLAEIFQQKITPLLQEYFYDDLERIQWVLYGKNLVTHSGLIINADQVDKYKNLNHLFDDEVKRQTPSLKRYRLNLAALHQADAYRQMLSPRLSNTLERSE